MDGNYLSRIRLLHVITGLARGGAERALSRITRGLDATRFESAVVALTPHGALGPEIRAAGVPVLELDLTGAHSALKSMAAARELVAKFRPDRVVGWMYHGNLAAFAIRRLWRRQARLDWNIRCSLYDIADFPRRTQWTIRLSARLSRFVDSLTYNAQSAVSQHVSHGFVSHRTHVIPNGFDLDEFAYSPAARHRIRDEIRVPQHARVAGLICRYHPQKSHRTFIEAASMVARELDAYFVMAGHGVTWSNLELVEWITSAGLKDRMRLLGERSDISSLLSAVDVACLTSTWGEGFPNILGEAMAAGVPCVATNVGDSAVVLGGAGAIVEPGDFQGLAAGLERIFSADVTERERLGEQCRRRIRTEFSIQRTLENYEHLFSDFGS